MELVDAAVPVQQLDPIKETILQVDGVKVSLSFFPFHQCLGHFLCSAFDIWPSYLPLLMGISIVPCSSVVKHNLYLTIFFSHPFSPYYLIYGYIFVWERHQLS